MTRKTKIILNLGVIVILCLAIMMSLGYYPGMAVLNMRIKLSLDAKEIVPITKDVDVLLVYTDTDLIYYELNDFIGFKSLSAKNIFKSNSNHFSDYKGNDWYEISKDSEVYELVNNDESDIILNKLDSKILTSNGRQYLLTPLNYSSKILIDSNGEKYWIGSTGYYGLQETYNTAFNVNLIDARGDDIQLNIENKVLVNFFEEKHPRNYEIYQNDESPNDRIVTSSYKKVMSYVRHFEDSSIVLENFYFDGKNIVLSKDILDQYGEKTTSPSLEAYLHPLVQEVFKRELLPKLLD